ncbi:TonB-dependent receptor [Sphingomonas sp. DBB INV C78]|uniref:TonB-dependent receptor n=1 Tax=Sphingomonas sp. DBB INV C78 TaxID=3349434 RepID=UPI0036D427E5
MKLDQWRLRASPLAVALILSSATPALAEEVAADAAASADAAAGADADSGDIIVTAQKRAESVQRVPISIAAFDNKALAAANVTSVQDLGRIATNVQINKGVQSSFLRLNVRGIGSASNTTIEPSVAVFVDNIYVPRAGAIVGSMLDMESVEVLRGPQGTLFGRNASVGALSLHSATPKQDFSGRVTGEIGNGDRYKLDGYVNMPIDDNMAVRVAGMGQWFGGYWKNHLDGKQYGGTDDIALRGSFRGQFGDFEWIVRADYSEIKGDGFTNIDFDEKSVSPTQLATLQARLGGQLPDTVFSDRFMNQYVTADLDDKQWGVSSTLSWDLDGSTLRLINSYRDWDSDQLDGDVIFTPAPILSRVGNFGSQSQNHELQFISPVREWFDGHFDMVAGLYYFTEDYSLGEKFQMNAQFCNVLTPPGPVRGACNNFLTANGGRDATNQQVTQTVDSYAAYSQLTWHFTEELQLTLGGRYTKDKKKGTYSQTITNPFVAGLRAPEVLTFPKIDDERFTYRVSLNYQPTRAMLFFANVSTGYKSAGYNSGGGSPALSTFDANGNLISTKRVFDRETSTNYELGAKTSWLDNRLTANLTFYRMDISGYQDRAFDGTSFTVLNAGKLRQQGFEYDMVMAPVRDFQVTASLAYLDSAFRDYPNAPGLPGLGGTQDLKGKPNTFSPEFTTRVAVDWSGDIGSTGMRWVLNGNLAFVSDQFYGLVSDANPQTVQDGYAVLGARVTINSADDQWSFSVFGNNLTNTQYTNGNLYQTLDGPLGLRNGVFPGSTAIRTLHADPRTYGASATFRF